MDLIIKRTALTALISISAGCGDAIWPGRSDNSLPSPNLHAPADSSLIARPIYACHRWVDSSRSGDRILVDIQFALERGRYLTGPTSAHTLLVYRAGGVPLANFRFPIIRAYIDTDRLRWLDAQVPEGILVRGVTDPTRYDVSAFVGFARPLDDPLERTLEENGVVVRSRFKIINAAAVWIPDRSILEVAGTDGVTYVEPTEGGGCLGPL